MDEKKNESCLDKGGHCKCPAHGSTKCPECTCSGAARDQGRNAQKEN